MPTGPTRRRTHAHYLPGNSKIQFEFGFLLGLNSFRVSLSIASDFLRTHLPPFLPHIPLHCIVMFLAYLSVYLRDIYCHMSVSITLHCLPFNCLAIASLFSLHSSPIHSCSFFLAFIALDVRVEELNKALRLSSIPFHSSPASLPFHAD